MFDTIQKKVKDDYDDDLRCVFEHHAGKVYFIWSNHHNGQLFVVICDEKPELFADIIAASEADEKREWRDGITNIIKKAMLAHGGIKLGDDWLG